ncbi:MAG: helicase HerA-like domain-containing protein, partial [Ruthenibacterium sp.]
RESAYEDLEKVTAQKQAEADAAAQEKAEAEKEKEEQKEALAAARLEKAQAAAERAKHPARRGKSALEKTVDSTLSTVGREFGRQLIRGLFGNLRHDKGNGKGKGNGNGKGKGKSFFRSGKPA